MSATPFGILWAYAGNAMLLAIAGILLVRGWRGRYRGDEPRCPQCAYNLTGLPQDRCPECGTRFTPATVVRGTRHRRPIMVVWGVLLLLIGIGGAVRPIQNYVGSIDFYQFHFGSS